MVGRPGRSKGCITCRRRKIKCDETRPACERCTSSGIECQGYKEFHWFIQQPAPNTSTRPTSKLDDADISKPEKRNIQTTVGPRNLQSPLLTSLSPPELDVFITFTVSSLFSASQVSNEPVVTSWPPLSYVGQGFPLADLCFNALATSFFGQRHQNRDIIKHGYRLYGSALQDLQRQINNPGQHQSMENLISVIVLNMFELLKIGSRTGWIEHGLGLGRLFELNGPETFMTPPARYVFEQSRLVMIVSSLAAHKRSFLARPEWKSIPWTLSPSPKPSIQLLLDILSDVTAVIEDRDAVRLLLATQPPNLVESGARLQQMTNYTYSLLDALGHWRQIWDLENPNAISEIRTTEMGIDGVITELCPFETVYRYLSSSQVNEICLYYTATILLLNLITSIPTLQRQPAAASSSLATEVDLYLTAQSPAAAAAAAAATTAATTTVPTSPFPATSHASAISICRSIHYKLITSSISDCKFFFLFPIRVALKGLFDTAVQERIWLGEVIKATGGPADEGWGIIEYD